MNQDTLIKDLILKGPEVFLSILDKLAPHAEQKQALQECINQPHSGSAVRDPELEGFEPHKGWSLLMYAARVGNKKLLLALKHLGANSNEYCAEDNKDALIVAIENGYSSAVEILAQGYLDVTGSVGTSNRCALDAALCLDYDWQAGPRGEKKLRRILAALLQHKNYDSRQLGQRFSQFQRQYEKALKPGDGEAKGAESVSTDSGSDTDSDDEAMVLPEAKKPFARMMLECLQEEVTRPLASHQSVRRMGSMYRTQRFSPMRQTMSRVVTTRSPVRSSRVVSRAYERDVPSSRVYTTVTRTVGVRAAPAVEPDWETASVARTASIGSVVAADEYRTGEAALSSRMASYHELDVVSARRDEAIAQAQRAGAKHLNMVLNRWRRETRYGLHFGFVTWKRFVLMTKCRGFIVLNQRAEQRLQQRYRQAFVRWKLKARASSDSSSYSPAAYFFARWQRAIAEKKSRHALKKVVVSWQAARLRQAFSVWRQAMTASRVQYAREAAPRRVSRPRREYLELQAAYQQGELALVQMSERIRILERQDVVKSRAFDEERLILRARDSERELSKIRLQEELARVLLDASSLRGQVADLERQLQSSELGKPSLRERFPHSEEIMSVQADSSHPAWIFVEEFRSNLMNVFILCLAVSNIEDLHSPLEKYMKQAGKVLKATGFSFASAAAGVINSASSYVAKAQISQSAYESVKFLSLAMSQTDGEKTVSDAMFERVDAIFFALGWQIVQRQNFCVGYDGPMNDKDITTLATYFFNRVRTVVNMEAFCGYHPTPEDAVAALSDLTFSKRHDLNMVRRLIKKHQIAKDEKFRGYIMDGRFYISRDLDAGEWHKVIFVFYTQTSSLPSHFVQVEDEQMTDLMERKIFMRFSKQLRADEEFTMVDISPEVQTRLKKYFHEVLADVNFKTLAMPHSIDALKSLIESLCQYVIEHKEDRELLKSPQEAAPSTPCQRFWACLCCKQTRPQVSVPKLASEAGRVLKDDVQQSVDQFLARHSGLRHTGLGSASAGVPAGATDDDRTGLLRHG